MSGPKKLQVIEARGHDGVGWKRMRVVSVEPDQFDATLLGFKGLVSLDGERDGRSPGVALAAKATFRVADRGVTWRMPAVAAPPDAADAIDQALVALGIPLGLGDFFREPS